jgi:hypothetical protein
MLSLRPSGLYSDISCVANRDLPKQYVSGPQVDPSRCHTDISTGNHASRVTQTRRLRLLAGHRSCFALT